MTRGDNAVKGKQGFQTKIQGAPGKKTLTGFASVEDGLPIGAALMMAKESGVPALISGVGGITDTPAELRLSEQKSYALPNGSIASSRETYGLTMDRGVIRDNGAMILEAESRGLHGDFAASVVRHWVIHPADQTPDFTADHLIEDFHAERTPLDATDSDEAFETIMRMREMSDPNRLHPSESKILSTLL